ncbi:MAG: TlpA family protein disulfide reductase [Desulfovibrio sp.]|nr:TlpA family protein disulfide reductase [Desulfovibrio sp.]
MKKYILSILLLLVSTVPVMASSVPTLDMAGLTSMLLQNRGKVVLLNFFATWCPPCRMEIPELVDVSRKYKSEDVLVISLSVDEQPDVVPPFIKKMHMNFPVYMAGKDLVRAFRVMSIPHNALYDRNGKRVFSEEGMLDAETVSAMLSELLKN